MTRSTVYCTNCSGQFIAELDLELNGNHEITCPLCQHIHYRVVRNGEVTEDRYRSSAGPTIISATFTVTNATINFGNTTGTSTISANDLWFSSTSITMT